VNEQTSIPESNWIGGRYWIGDAVAGFAASAVGEHKSSAAAAF
jgi:hypothetical protein